MRVKLSLDPSTDAFEASGEVAWCAEGRGSGYEVGIRFSASDAARSSLISQLREVVGVKN